MLRCFGMVGLSQLQAPLVEFLISEAFATKTLSNSQRSCRTYWLPAVEDAQERLRLGRLITDINQQL